MFGIPTPACEKPTAIARGPRNLAHTNLVTADTYGREEGGHRGNNIWKGS